MPGSRRLLSVVELGGYPDFTPLYRRLGYEVVGARSLRKALGLLKGDPPDVVVSEFVYGPMYSTRISTLESLIAGMQRDAPSARLVVFFDPEHREHLERLRDHYGAFAALSFPIDPGRLESTLAGIGDEAVSPYGTT
ncbi:MAG: hypothetical protein PVG82_04985 [Chromatiales bacterium]|jgi:hypothetical protein